LVRRKLARAGLVLVRLRLKQRLRLGRRRRLAGLEPRSAGVHRGPNGVAPRGPFVHVPPIHVVCAPPIRRAAPRLRPWCGAESWRGAALQGRQGKC
jgi:hypothetical protein